MSSFVDLVISQNELKLLGSVEKRITLSCTLQGRQKGIKNGVDGLRQEKSSPLRGRELF